MREKVDDDDDSSSSSWGESKVNQTHLHLFTCTVLSACLAECGSENTPFSGKNRIFLRVACASVGRSVDSWKTNVEVEH